MAKLIIRKTRNLWQLSLILLFFVPPFQLVIGTKLPTEFDSMYSKEGKEKNVKASPMEDLKSGRIVGGTDAQLGSYPFFVLLEGDMTGLLCGGSLVAPDVVLTAGHCDPYGQSDFYVYVNAYAMSENAYPNKEFQTMSTEKRKRSDFDLDTYSNDLLLLKLMDPVPLDMFPPVNLNMDRLSFGQEFRVLGLGSKYEGGPYAEVLQEVIVKQVNTKDCASSYAREGFDIVNSTIMFCAKGSGKDACQGDSGGPILDLNGSQVGIISFGLGCARDDFPGVYVRLSSFKLWVEQNICDLSAYCGVKGQWNRPTKSPTKRIKPSENSTPNIPTLSMPKSVSPILKPTAIPIKAEYTNSSPTLGPTSQPSLEFSSHPSVMRTSNASLIISKTEIPSIKVSQLSSKQPNIPLPPDASNTLLPSSMPISTTTYTESPSISQKPSMMTTDLPSLGVASPLLSPFDLELPINDTNPVMPSSLSPTSIPNTESPSIEHSRNPSMHSSSVEPSKSPSSNLEFPNDADIDEPVNAFYATNSLHIENIQETNVISPTIPPSLPADSGDSKLESCHDNLNGTFFTGQLGRRNCDWLSSQPSLLRKAFCTPASEAFNVCPRTCGKCKSEY